MFTYLYLIGVSEGMQAERPATLNYEHPLKQGTCVCTPWKHGSAAAFFPSYIWVLICNADRLEYVSAELNNLEGANLLTS